MCPERLTLFVLCLGVATVSFAAEQAPLDAALATCAAIEDDEPRLACFDELAQTAKQAPKAAPSAPAQEKPAEGAAAGAATPAAGTATRPLTDDVGRRQVDGGSQDDDKDEVYVAQLAGCERGGPSERLYFLLDNGQAWRQSDSDRVRLRNCDGEVRISRDFFGYKLSVVNEDVTVRVRRVR